jgi:hypothetical protein
MWELGWIPAPSQLPQFDQMTLIAYRSGEKKEIDEAEKYLLFSLEEWMYVPYEKRIEEYRKDPDGYIANMYGESFKRSRRPYTAMEHFIDVQGKRNVIQLRRDPSGRPQKVLLPDGKTTTVLPVTRYGEKGGEGTYYGQKEDNQKEEDYQEKEENKDKEEKEEKEENKEKEEIMGTHSSFCGTFYYWEPDSDVFLDLGKNAFFPNKITALYALDRGNERVQRVMRNFYLTLWGKDYIDSSKEKNQEDTTKKLFALFSGRKDPLFLFDDFYQDLKEITWVMSFTP